MKININLHFSTLGFLIGFNFLIFALVFLTRFMLESSSFTEEDFITFGGLVVRNGELKQISGLVASNFFHIDIIHMLLNMYALWRLGDIVTRFYGDQKLFITYIIGGVGSTIIAAIGYIIFGSDLVSLGASGSIFALAGLLVGGSIKKYRYGNALPFSIWDFMSLILLSLLIDFSNDIRINHLAHFGGLFTGIILGIIFKHSFEYYEQKFDKNILKLLFYVSLFLFISAYSLLILNLIF